MRPDQHNDDRRITYFAATHTRGKREMFGIRAIDRGKHMYVIGKTGMGKSTMLENMAIQDIQNGEGIAYIDPHGSTAEKLLDFVPFDRIKDVVYFAPFDVDHPSGFNVMEDVGYDKRHLVVSGLMGALKRIWVDAWSARMEYILQNTLLALLEYPGSTLLDVNRMLTNKTFRLAVIDKVTDPIVRAFWTEEFANFTDTYTREATPAIQNKIGQFTANPLIRNIVGQPTSSFDLRKIMDEKKIFIVNLSKGRMGESNASLLGSMLTVKIYLAAMSRADEPAARMAKLPRCYFYVDEFQSMMNEAFADILSESRKYKLALTLANQYIEQMEENVRDAVFGNVGTLITFRVGPFDAETLKTVFEPTFTAEDLVGLGIGEIYLTLMIDGVGSAPFSAQTIPPIEAPNISYREDVVTHSRANYGRTRQEVEKVIAQKQAEFIPPPPEPKKKREYGPPRTNGGGGGNYGNNNGGGGYGGNGGYNNNQGVPPNFRPSLGEVLPPQAFAQRPPVQSAPPASPTRDQRESYPPSQGGYGGQQGYAPRPPASPDDQASRGEPAQQTFTPRPPVQSAPPASPDANRDRPTPQGHGHFSKPGYGQEKLVSPQRTFANDRQNDRGPAPYSRPPQNRPASPHASQGGPFSPRPSQGGPAAPRGQYIPASQQNKAGDPREALRAAIQQAKKDAERPASPHASQGGPAAPVTPSSVPSEPARSPAEILRERKGPDTRASTEGNAPQKPASTDTTSHGHSPHGHPHKPDRIVPSQKERFTSPHADQNGSASPVAREVKHASSEQERGESVPPHPKHDHPPAPRDQDNGEISNEVLRRVLHPGDGETEK
ncbi:type IV secretion system DNA-binding domain-containing protein [Candidatus Kaiserbacteria bacterium]|nr:type IV secretion system DNA-binding domain-containing protein [Candidatus Kaiserbacteria bacterium]